MERSGRTPVVHVGKVTDLKILRDSYVLEVFVNHGEAAYTVLL
ncbi:MAG: GH32 C-terminal domain-containing protein [Clostridia bacterium]|nr:GH32 C-terminal domain-containing protein [Clostridia bacterium]